MSVDGSAMLMGSVFTLSCKGNGAPAGSSPAAIHKDYSITESNVRTFNDLGVPPLVWLPYNFNGDSFDWLFP